MLMPEAGNRGTARGIENAAAVLGNQPCAIAAHGPGRCFAQAAVHHAAGSGAHHGQPLSVTYCRVSARRASVSSSRRLAVAPPSMQVAAASDCAIAVAPVRLGKNPGEDAASNSNRCSAPSAIGDDILSAIEISVAPERCAARADSTLAVEYGANPIT